MDSLSKLIDDCSLPPMVYVMRHPHDEVIEICIRGRSFDELDESDFAEMFAMSIANRAHMLGREYERRFLAFHGHLVNFRLEPKPDLEVELDPETIKYLFGDKLDG